MTIMFNSSGSGNTRCPSAARQPRPFRLRHFKRHSFDLKKLYTWVGASVGSYAGWLVGSLFGLMTAYTVMFIGIGVGIYLGRRLAHF
jgi:hypothetical protein